MALYKPFQPADVLPTQWTLSVSVSLLAMKEDNSVKRLYSVKRLSESKKCSQDCQMSSI